MEQAGRDGGSLLNSDVAPSVCDPHSQKVLGCVEHSPASPIHSFIGPKSRKENMHEISHTLHCTNTHTMYHIPHHTNSTHSYTHHIPYHTNNTPHSLSLCLSRVRAHTHHIPHHTNNTYTHTQHTKYDTHTHTKQHTSLLS